MKLTILILLLSQALNCLSQPHLWKIVNGGPAGDQCFFFGGEIVDSLKSYIVFNHTDSVNNLFYSLSKSLSLIHISRSLRPIYGRSRWSPLQ